MSHTPHHSSAPRTSLGIWTYLMSDCILFAALLATYAVLRTETAGGPGAGELFSLTFVLVETLLLLSSSFTCGLAVICAQKKHVAGTWIALVATFLLGLGFVGMELHEFSQLVAEGHSWTQSAFLSSFFTLVGMHGLHVAAGLLFILVILIRMLLRGLDTGTTNGIKYFSLFWHFLDIVWICVVTLVYLLGAL